MEGDYKGERYMEDRLKGLVDGNSETNRKKWAMEWKKQGKKVIGVMSSYVPEEVISAAGMLPFRITGTWQENISRARVYYHVESNCAYCNHVLESFLSGELDFLDGIIATDQDDVLRVTFEVLEYLKKKPFSCLIHIPFFESELNYRYFAGEIRRLITRLEDFSGVKITEDSMHSSIDTYNQMRDLLNQVYEMRKKEIPPLSGAEALGIITTAQVMPKENFNSELETLLPYLEKRQTNLKQVKPRLLLSSDHLDDQRYLELVEESCLIAMDDMDTGIRYFIKNVENDLEDPAYALAKRYLSRHGAPNIAHWDRQAEQLIKWVKEYNIDGILSLPITWCYSQTYRMPWLSRELEKAGIPSISLEREYQLANAGQLRTRIGAFLEMLGTKKQ
jgi:benzoyl-CoA reductase/2-hydroxyglutaryl-CoA dehydratase subunit BcrC/BadD/HgdB